MKKKFRIKANEEFTKIIRQKHIFSSASFLAYASKANLEYPRIGISVSKKLGNAVERNKIKRQIREIIHETFDFNAYPYDLIIICKEAYIQRNYVQNKNDFEKLIKKVIINKYEKGDKYE